MSRIGRLPITVPSGVDVTIDGRTLTVKGPKGSLTRELHPDMTVAREDDRLVVTRPTEQKTAQAAPRPDPDARQQHGSRRDRRLSQVARDHRVGYRAAKVGEKLQLNLGYSHPIEIAPPTGISFEVENPTHLAVLGIDKELVGQVAAQVRSTRKPEPYKGKGVNTRASTSAARPARPARSAARSNDVNAEERAR
jgi:large subunit ribosomal protein L6